VRVYIFFPYIDRQIAFAVAVAGGVAVADPERG